jgi:hypothetical protein
LRKNVFTPNSDTITFIRNCFDADAVLYSRHGRFEMENEESGKIFEHEVYETLQSGEVIEEYPDDKPYPSVLISGRTATGRPLHVVCAYSKTDDLVVVVTVYSPNEKLWIDYSRRKKI